MATRTLLGAIKAKKGAKVFKKNSIKRAKSMIDDD